MENIYDKDYAPFMEEAQESMVQMPHRRDMYHIATKRWIGIYPVP